MGIERDFDFPSALASGIVSSNRGPATTDIKGAQLGGRFDLDALLGPQPLSGKLVNRLPLRDSGLTSSKCMMRSIDYVANRKH
jgi:hypothetical protein